jgi:hypothetical protein
VGRRKKALAAIQEATDLHRELAAACPDAFRPDLARSLNNLSVWLGDLGRREEALAAIQEATDLYRELAVRWPDAYQTSWSTHCVLLVGSSRRKTSARYPYKSLGRDNGPLSRPSAWLPAARSAPSCATHRCGHTCSAGECRLQGNRPYRSCRLPAAWVLARIL